MNFLAHAWVLPERAPDLVLGAVLPDPLGAFDRRAPRLDRDGAKLLHERGRPVLARGVLAHHAADSSFHELEGFKAGCADLKPLAARLNENGARVRGFFFAHLLLEILLDATLLEDEPALAREFYSAVGAAAAPPDRAGFEVFLDRFVRARFLEDYATDQGIAFRLGQVLGRARQGLGTAEGLLVEELPRARSLVRARLASLVLEPRARVHEALS